jgi:hypothetical protein
MQTFIRAVEYWVPSSDGSILEFGAGAYGTGRHLESLSHQMCFGLGEGLPGQAWELGHPIILKKFEGSYFRRTAAAHAVGITCGIAIPIHVGDTLQAVMVLFCGEDTAMAGAIELWRSQPKESTDMTLVDGHYGNTGDTFEFISRSTIFRQGTGLPGLVWASQKPLFLDDLGRGGGFLRADSAVKVGINRGFAVPCTTTDGSVFVLAMLSALATPITRRLEIWEPDAASQSLRLTGGFCETDGALGAATTPIALADSPAAMVLATRMPVIVKTPAHSSMVAWPVLHEERVTAVVAIYL